MPTITADGIYYVDLGPDSDFTPGSFISCYPEQLTFDDAIRSIGNCAWQITFSALDQDGALVVTPDFIGPYRSYFRLRYGNAAIMAGTIINVHTKLGDDFMSIAGKTWEHYFEREYYPFDPRATPSPGHIADYSQAHYEGNELTPSGSLITGLAYEAHNRDVILILGDLLSEIQNSVSYHMVFDISTLVASGVTSLRTNYQLAWGDTSYVNSIIESSLQVGQGFDWWITWDRKIYWATPFRFGNPASPVIIYTFDGSDDAHTPMNLEFDNIGPAFTHLFGTGSGLATQTQLGAAVGDTLNEASFHRLDGTVSFGDVRNYASLLAMVRRAYSMGIQPVHNIPLSVNPADIPDFWTTFRKGRAIYINYDLGYHHINSPQQIKSYSAKTDDAGNVTVDFTLDQIYDINYDYGTPEG